MSFTQNNGKNGRWTHYKKHFFLLWLTLSLRVAPALLWDPGSVLMTWLWRGRPPASWIHTRSERSWGRRAGRGWGWDRAERAPRRAHQPTSCKPKTSKAILEIIRQQFWWRYFILIRIFPQFPVSLEEKQNPGLFGHLNEKSLMSVKIDQKKLCYVCVQAWEDFHEISELDYFGDCDFVYYFRLGCSANVRK